MKKKCTNCGEVLREDENYVLLGTYKDNKGKTKTIGEDWFHIKCWQKYFNERVKKKFEVMQKQMMGMAGKMVGDIMKNVKGSDF